MNSPNSYPNFRWFVLLVLVVSTAAQAVLMITPAPLVGEIARVIGQDPGTTTGLIMGVWNIVGATSCLGSGFLVDRYGISKMLIIGSILLFLPTLLFPLAGNSLKVITGLRFVQALGVGPVTAVLAPIAASWFPPQQRGMVAGIQGVSTSLGVMIGFMVAPALFTHTRDWLSVMAWVSLVPLVSLCLSVALHFGPRPQTAIDGLSQEDKAKSQILFARALRTPSTWFMIAAVFMCCWFFTGFNDLTPGYLAIARPTGLGYGPVVAGKLMAVYQIFFMLGAFAGGLVFEKILRESVRATVGIGFLVSGLLSASIMLPTIYGQVAALRAVLMLTGFFASWAVPVCMAFIALNYHPSIAGRLTGLTFGIALYAGIPGIIVGSAALKYTGSYHTSITVVAIASLFGVVLAQFIKPLRDRVPANAQALGVEHPQ